MASQRFHATGVPILVSPALLRARGLGQCDLVRLLTQERLIELREVKGQHKWLSRTQAQRLHAAGAFLAMIFAASVVLRVGAD